MKQFIPIILIILIITQTKYCQTHLDKLKPYNVDLYQTSTSGLSAGAFMAVQFHIAFSEIMIGAGIVAGGPFACAQGEIGTALTACMKTPKQIDLNTLNQKMLELNKNNQIDNLQNLEDQRVYLFSGSKDTTVVPGVMTSLVNQYATFGVILQTDFDVPAQHAWITQNYGNKCNYSGEPYINNCLYNQAYKIFNHIYKDLKLPGLQQKKNLFSFDQTPYKTQNDSLGDTGYLYVPTSCQKGKQCRIHIAFHGCKQTIKDIDLQFVQKTGLNQYAETNNVIVLYPQCSSSLLNPNNPNGCFDWWGYTDDNLFGKSFDYATKQGKQMNSIYQMVLDLVKNKGLQNQKIK